jgi:hypothetical protein
MFSALFRSLWVKLRRTQYEHMFSLCHRIRTLLDAVGMSQKCQYATLEMQEAIKPKDALFVCTPSSEQKSAPLLGARILLDIGQVDGVTFHE